jgi:hypothetical protein
MVSNGDWVLVASLRRQLYGPLYALLLQYEGEGWRLRRQGHGWRFYCPCGSPHDPRRDGMVAISSTPQNAHSHYLRVRRSITGH